MSFGLSSTNALQSRSKGGTSLISARNNSPVFVKWASTGVRADLHTVILGDDSRLLREDVGQAAKQRSVCGDVHACVVGQGLARSYISK